MKAHLREHFKTEVLSWIEPDIAQIKAVLQDLNRQVTELQAFQDQAVTWVFSGTEVNAEAELEALYANGLRKIDVVAPEKADQLELGEPDLVILSFDGSDEARARLRRIVETLKTKKPPVSLIIYTHNTAGKEVRIEKEEREILKDFLWYLPVNFPTTLLAQTQLLIRKKRKQADG